MTEQNKQRTQELLRSQLNARGENRKPLSQRKWGDQHGISNATISNVLSGKWDLIADKMWRQLAAAVGNVAREWTLANTRDFKLLNDFADRARNEAITLAVSFRPGSGKTETLRNYAQTHANVVYLECADHWSKRHFLRMLYRALGHDPKEMTVVELADSIVSVLRKTNKPLIILDELDKLNERTLLYLIHLYNQLDGVCGFLYSGSDHLKLKMERGCARDKRGYRELFSRMGGKFASLNGSNRKDVAIICAANGITEPEEINEIWNEFTELRDIRRVKRMVENRQQQQHKEAA